MGYYTDRYRAHAGSNIDPVVEQMFFDADIEIARLETPQCGEVTLQQAAAIERWQWKKDKRDPLKRPVRPH